MSLAGAVQAVQGAMEQLQKQLEEELQQLQAEQDELKKQKDALENEKQLMQTLHGENIPEVVELNVGGRSFATLRNTLCRFEGTTLSAMFSGRWKLPKDSKGRYFIDRNPKFFELVLDYLRDPEIQIRIDPDEKATFFRELDYYGLKELMFPYLGGPKWKFTSDSAHVVINENGSAVSKLRTSWSSAKGDNVFTTGKFHWRVSSQYAVPEQLQIRIDSLQRSCHEGFLGVGHPTVPLDYSNGHNSTASSLLWGFWACCGAIFSDSRIVRLDGRAAVGDIIQFDLDMDTKELIISKNGKRLEPSLKDLPTQVVPIVILYQDTTRVVKLDDD